MIKEIKKLKNNHLDYNNLEENQLSIQLSLDGFSFCIYNKITEQIGVLGIYKFEYPNITPYKHLELVKELYEQEPLLNNKYHQVKITHYNNLVTQVPKPFFNKNHLNLYLQYTVKVLENDFITFDEVENTEIVNVYIPFVNINNFFIDIYGAFDYKHAATVFLESTIPLAKNSKNDSCFVNVHGHHFEIVVIKNQKFELYNHFSFSTEEDFIYYILFTAEQLQLNTEIFELVLMGDIEKESALFSILFKYIRNVKFFEPTTNKTIKGESSHASFTLLNT